MTKRQTNIISRCRNLILCFAIMLYGLPVTVMAASPMMSSGMSHDMSAGMSHDMSVNQECPDTMANHGDMGSSDKGCCDAGNCDYSCMGLSLALIATPTAYLKIISGSFHGPFTDRLAAVTLSGEQPPPRA